MKRHNCFRVLISALVIISILVPHLLQATRLVPSAQAKYEEPPTLKTEAPAEGLPGSTMLDLDENPLTEPGLVSREARFAPLSQAGASPSPSRTDLVGEVVPVGAGLSVNSGSGALNYHGIEFTIPNRGPAFQVSLRYQSLYRESDESWGYGWEFDRDWRYQVEDNGDVTVLLNQGSYNFINDGQGSFISPSEGITLTQQADTLLLSWSDGRELYFESPAHQRVTRWGEATGGALTFAYNGDGRLEAISNPQGRQMGFVWDGNRLQTIVDRESRPPRQLRLEYTSTGDLVGVTDALSNTTVLSYDADHRLIGVTEPHGGETVITYDGDYVTMVERGGVTTSFIVDEESNTITIREEDEAGAIREQVYTYDYRGLLGSTTYPDRTRRTRRWGLLEPGQYVKFWVRNDETPGKEGDEWSTVFWPDKGDYTVPSCVYESAPVDYRVPVDGGNLVIHH